jgi:hypothetical protein
MSFWDNHGVFFIFFMFFFPRLTLLFSSVPFGGFFWWLGWIFAPRLLVAILATMAYLQTNPMLVFLAWIWATLLEVFEKRGAHWTVRRPRTPFVFRFTRGRRAQKNNAEPPNPSQSSGQYGDDVIDI